MNKRSKARNKDRNKYAKLKSLVDSTVKGRDPLGIPNCSASLVKDEINFIGMDNAKYVEKMALYKKQRIERGFDDTELWNLEFSIAKYVLPRLIEYRKVMNGYPASVNTFEEFQEIVDKMIYAFDHIVNEDKYTDDLEKELEIDWNGCYKTTKLPDGNYQLEHTEKYNSEKINKYREEQNNIGEKIDEGLRLFGEYFRALWW